MRFPLSDTLFYGFLLFSPHLHTAAASFFFFFPLLSSPSRLEHGDSGTLTLLRHEEPLVTATNYSSGGFQLLPATGVQPSSPKPSIPGQSPPNDSVLFFPSVLLEPQLAASIFGAEPSGGGVTLVGGCCSPSDFHLLPYIMLFGSQTAGHPCLGFSSAAF